MDIVVLLVGYSGNQLVREREASTEALYNYYSLTGAREKFFNCFIVSLFIVTDVTFGG